MVMYSAWSVLATKVVRQCLSIVCVNHMATGSSIYERRQIKSFWIIKIAQAIDKFGFPILYVFYDVNVRGSHCLGILYVGSYKCCVHLFKQLTIEKKNVLRVKPTMEFAFLTFAEMCSSYFKAEWMVTPRSFSSKTCLSSCW